MDTELRRGKEREGEGEESENASEESYQFDDNESSGMETTDFSDGDGDEDPKNGSRIKTKKDSIQSRINSARNWMIGNVLFLIFVITLLAVFYGLGWLKFETGFNESIN